MRMQKISVLIIESHPLMREALCAAIVDEPGLAVVASAASSVEASSLAGTLRPDVILLALDNPGAGDMDPLAALRRAFPAASILALTANESPKQEKLALASGARGVLTKAASRDELLRTLRGMHRKVARKTPEPG